MTSVSCFRSSVSAKKIQLYDNNDIKLISLIINQINDTFKTIECYQKKRSKTSQMFIKHDVSGK